MSNDYRRDNLHSFDGSPAMELVCMYSEQKPRTATAGSVHVRAWHGGFAVTQYTVGLILRERRNAAGELERREMFARHGLSANELVRESIALADEWLNMADMGVHA